MSALPIHQLSNLGTSEFKVSTGSIKLDAALNGGFHSGNIYEIYGSESTGKTSIALRALDQAISTGLRSLCIDAEFKLNDNSVKEMGVSPEIMCIKSSDQNAIFNFLLSPEFYENFDIVAIDTLTSLISTEDAMTPVGADSFSDSAINTSEFLKKFKVICAKENVCCIFIDQIRFKSNETVPTHTRMGYEQNTTFKLDSSACNAVEHYSTARIELYEKRELYVVKNANRDDIDTPPIGQETLFRISKNHQGRPGLKGKLTFIFGSGFSQDLELADYGIKLGILKVENDAVVYDNQIIATSKLQLIDFMKNMDDVRKKISENINAYEGNMHLKVHDESNKRDPS
tara:strand:+ start:59226 stop:60254 length:1029 start_codon:yes stop_codon:yes gene_type:complete